MPNICPYEYTLFRLTKHSAVSRQALEPGLVGRAGRGGSEARHRDTEALDPRPRPSAGPRLSPRLQTPSPPPATFHLHPEATWGLHALLSPFPKLLPSPHPGEEQGAEDGRGSKGRSKPDPTHDPERDRCTEEFLLPCRGHKAPKSPTGSRRMAASGHDREARGHWDHLQQRHLSPHMHSGNALTQESTGKRTAPGAPAGAAGAPDNSSPADAGGSFTMEGGAEARRSEVPECSARRWQNNLHAHQHATLPPQDKLFQENENPCSVRFLRMHGNGPIH